MIEIKKLYKNYGSKLILEDINLTVEKDELVVVYGRNGAGKTTLIKCLVGLLKCEKEIIQLIPSEKSKIGLVLTTDLLIEKLTITEYLNLVCKLKNIQDKEKINKKIIELSKRLSFFNDVGKLISTLSSGTKSKVLFAASIINDPKNLILDEPFVGMDLISIRDSVELLCELKQKGCSIIISSHQIDVLEGAIDRILILKNKRIMINAEIKIIKKDMELSNYKNLSDFIIFKMETL